MLKLMRTTTKLFIGFNLIICFYACQNSQPNSSSTNNASTDTLNKPKPVEYSRSVTPTYNSDFDDDDISGDDELDGTKIEDGTYSATVDYYNPSTGYSATYTLDVEVQDGEVVQIDFPNGGYLDEDHITPAELDEDGNATVDGEEGKTYQVHIDN